MKKECLVFFVVVSVLLSIILSLGVSAADCGSNIDCFITAAGTCSASSVTNVSAGLTEIKSGTNLLEIGGISSSKCNFYYSLVRIDFTDGSFFGFPSRKVGFFCQLDIAYLTNFLTTFKNNGNFEGTSLSNPLFIRAGDYLELNPNCQGFEDSVISLGSCSDPDQTLFKINEGTNAHAEAYNSAGNYQGEICFNNIFDNEFLGENPHDCTANPSNVILRISEGTNAHAETPTGNTAGYTNLCYGTLQCRNTTGECQVPEEMIIALSAETNAHLSLVNDDAYPIKICCKQMGKLLDANWTDLTGRIISTADSKDTVSLLVKGENLQNQQVKFEIYNATQMVIERTITASPLQESSISTSWQVPSGGVYYFNATLINTGQRKWSNDLVFSPNENNTAPVARITSPRNGAIYLQSVVISFNQSSYDFDDLIARTNWDFGDNINFSGNGIINTTHPYTYAGPKQIVLTVTDSRDAKGSNSSSVLILNETGYYALAVIDAPSYNQQFSNFDVTFDARSSYVIYFNAGVTPATVCCVAGSCPGIFNSAPITNCPGYPKPLVYRWQETPEGQTVEGTEWDEIPAGQVELTHPGRHDIKLRVSLQEAPGIFSEVTHPFYIYPSFPVCFSDDNWLHSYWWEGDTVRNSFEECKKDNGKPQPTCCPAGYRCNTESNFCEPSTEQFCSDYKNSSDCSSDLSNVASYDISFHSGKNCGEFWINQTDGCSYKIMNCRCTWDSGDSVCNSAYTQNKSCRPGEPGTTGECTFITTEQTNCTGGYRYLRWNALWDGKPTNSTTPDYCKPGEITTACLSETILPFASTIGIILAIVLIMLYAYHTLKKRKKNEKT